MSTEDDNGPDERMRRELARLPRELIPPKGLEARVVAALRERDHLAAARSWPNPWRLGGAVAAGLALLFAGFWVGRHKGRLGQPLPVPSYLLMMRGGADFNPEGWPQARLEAEMGEWARRRIGVRRFVIGEKLDTNGWIITSSRVAGMSPLDLPEAPDGIFVIAASSDEEALGIAKSCPMLRHGGSVEVRRIDPT